MEQADGLPDGKRLDLIKDVPYVPHRARPYVLCARIRHALCKCDEYICLFCIVNELLFTQSFIKIQLVVTAACLSTK